MTVAIDTIDSSVLAWLTEHVTGQITRLERAPARRQAWLVDTSGPGQAAYKGFLRLSVPGDPANDPDVLWRERLVVESLLEAGFLVPTARAADRALGVVLYDRVPGEWQLHDQTPAQQSAVYDHYMELLATLHKFDVEALRLNSVLTAPHSARACALGPVEAAMDSRGQYPDKDDPLEVFALNWLRRNVPDRCGPLSLVHGDAGVGNFLFVDDRVTAVLDWEWAHIGDPMEDLAAVNIHASFFPSGSMRAMLQRYEVAGGAPVDLDRIRFYRVENMLRSVVSLRAITARLDSRDQVGLNVAYRLLCERFLCDCLADALGIELAPAHLPQVEEHEPSLHEFVTDNLRHVVVPKVEAGWARDQALSAVCLLEYLARCQRFRGACEQIEEQELSILLGHHQLDLASARSQLGADLTLWGSARDEAVLRYLAARCRREELLAAPLMSVLPRVQLQSIS